MLTRKSPGKGISARYFLAIPIAIAATMLCTQNVFSHPPTGSGNTVTFRGNEVEFGARKFDVNAISLIPYPVKVNGQPILDVRDESLTQKLKYTNGAFEDFLIAFVKDELSTLPDADNYQLDINDLVIDEDGKVAYYRIENIRQFFPQPRDPNMPYNAQSPLSLQFLPVQGEPSYKVVKQNIPQATIDAVKNDLEAALAKAQFKPAMKDGKNVPVLTGTTIRIEVKAGKVSFSAGGC